MIIADRLSYHQSRREGMEVTLRAISPDNWLECLNLEVQDDQQAFIPPNVYSLAQAKVFAECIPLAIYAGERMIGFLMYEFAPDSSIPWIIRFMIDHKYQGRGYGRAALQEAIMLIEAQSERDNIKLRISPDNPAAERLFRSLGFEPTSESREGASVMCLHLQ
jgi:diamine N-acetyltransferase